MSCTKRLAVILVSVAFLALFVLPATAAQIKRFTDSRGVIHITNGPGPQQAATASPGSSQGLPSPGPQAASPAAPEAGQVATVPQSPGPEPAGKPGDTVSGPPVATAGTEARPAAQVEASSRPELGDKNLPGDGPRAEPPQGQLRRVAFEVPPAGQTRPAAPDREAPPGSIRSYRDRRGVLHITNVSPGEPMEVPPSFLKAAKMAAAAPAKAATTSPGPEEPAAGPQQPIQKVSWTFADFLPRPPPATPAPPSMARAEDGAIRRYRDGKGVLRIENVEPHHQSRPPPPPLALAAATVGDLGGRLSPSPPMEVVRDRSSPPGLTGSQVVAFRDRRGKITVRNAEQGVSISRAPPEGLDLAALDPLLWEAAQLYRLPIALVLAVVKVESNFVPWAVSPKGAMGLMQLMPQTAAFLGVTDPFSPRQNLLGGCRYLRLLLDCFNGSLPLALAAYNAGYQRVIDAGFQVPAIKETQDFVTRILGIYYQAVGGNRPLAWRRAAAGMAGG